jgi:5-methyltetrahydrofolate--homocysteine methyltransferase
MAKDTEGKLRIAKRLYEFACVKHGLPASDLMFDHDFHDLYGNETTAGLLSKTLDSLSGSPRNYRVSDRFGLSNVSFGLSLLPT